MASRSVVVFGTLLFYIYGFPVTMCQCHNSTAMSIQVDSLLAEYDREVLPSNHGAVTVHISLDLKHASVDQKDATMRLIADLKLNWVDKRISWNETDWDCDQVITSAERLWLPDIVPLNSAAAGVSSSPIDVGMKARLTYDGTVSWAMRLDLTASITLQLYDWPKDTQMYIFKFGSRSFNVDEIILSIFKHGSAMFEDNEWNISGYDDDVTIWNRDGDQLSVARFLVQVTRRAPAHSLAATTVVIASGFMLFAAIVLHPDQRHALAACASFTAALWLITCLVRLPGAHTCPRVLSVMCALCLCGAACSVCAGLVRRIALFTASPPRLLRTTLHALSSICSLTPSPDTCTSESGAWAAAAVLADRIFCAALSIAVFVLIFVQLS